MKFRFCGDGDCPDWVLAEILSTLSMLSSVKLRLIAQTVAKGILGQELPEEKLKETFASSKNEDDSAKSAVASIRFLLISAARYNTDEATFGEELQQLGLPKEHAMSLCRVLADNLPDLRNILMDSCLKVNELDGVSSSIPSNTIDCAQLEVKIQEEIVDGISQNMIHKVNIHKADVRILLNEMKQLKSIMDSYVCDNAIAPKD